MGLVHMFKHTLVQKLTPEVTLKSLVTWKSFVFIQSGYMPSYIVLGSMVSELHDVRMIRLLKAVTSGWVPNTISFTLVTDHVRYYSSFEVLEAKVKCFFVGPEHPVSRTLNKPYSVRNGPNNVTSIYFTQGWQLNILSKFHDRGIN